MAISGYPPPMDQACVEHLSITRSSRLLRQVRIRCSALVATSKRTALPSVPITATYSRKTFAQPALPPLCILPSPDNSFTRLDAANSELSRKIYAVRDIFRDIVEKTATRRARSGATQMPSLTSLCSFLIGSHADPDIDEQVTRSEEEQSVDIVEALYSEIPAVYRGLTFVSHATNIIINECPSSPTLLKLLLDVALDNNLHYHSRILLRNLLLIAVSPSTSTRPPPICHSAHSNFLTDLLSGWEQRGCQASTFFKIFNEVMANVGSFDAWICKATTKLVQKDPLQLASASSLVVYLSNSKLHVPSRQFSISQMTSASPTGIVRRSLRIWINCTLHCLLLSMRVIDSWSVAEFLQTCQECWVYLGTTDNATTAYSQDPIPAIISLTTLLLSDGRRHDVKPCLQVLGKQFSPIATIFSPLISATLAFSDHLPKCKKRIEVYASALREHGFLQLEALVWASALREMENESSVRRYDKSAVYEYRNTLIELVEEAEKRCYGSQEVAKDAPGIGEPRGWEWDEAFDCWTLTGETQSSLRRKRPYRDKSCSNIGIKSLNQSQKRRRVMGRTSSFTSLLLSSALSNRVVLHRENEQGESSDEERTEDLIVDRNMAHPSSDDCLDLFAYPSSSPARS
ncbi:hypothetical protein D9757_004359 [Collybiopsis confluens]|uniref:Uncharacterized protein n=1 Tax=Collybiopsis confluens TaxID=2823264 RepID=A0A8H5MD45_9AGAR|nr:hypothetical protein D9757_004359 [Collybiopsis confluens]